MRSLTWGCGQEEDPAGSSGGAEDPAESLPGEEGPRLRRDPAGDPGREEDPAASPAGRSERGEGIRGGGSSKVFHGGRRERGNPTVCVPGSQRDPRAGGSGAIPRLSPCPRQGSAWAAGSGAAEAAACPRGAAAAPRAGSVGPPGC